jgi:hypothetical protein
MGNVSPLSLKRGRSAGTTALSSSDGEPNFLKELLNGPPSLAMLESGAPTQPVPNV